MCSSYQRNHSSWSNSEDQCTFKSKILSISIISHYWSSCMAYDTPSQYGISKCLSSHLIYIYNALSQDLKTTNIFYLLENTSQAFKSFTLNRQHFHAHFSPTKGTIIKNSNQYNKKIQDYTALEHNSFKPTLHTIYAQSKVNNNKKLMSMNHWQNIRLKEMLYTSPSSHWTNVIVPIRPWIFLHIFFNKS